MLLEPGFQGVDAFLELPQGIAYGAQIGLHGRRGLFPVLARKGEGAGGIVGWQRLSHSISGLRKSVHTLALFIVGKPDDVQCKTLGIDRGVI